MTEIEKIEEIIEEEQEENINPKFATIDKYESNELIQKVLTGKTCFEYEVEDYYRLDEEDIILGDKKDKRKSFRSESRKGAPENLVNVLENFYPEVKLEKLGYDSVREDFGLYHNKLRTFGREYGVPLGIASLGGLGFAMFGPELIGPLDFILGFGSAISAVGNLIWAAESKGKPSGSRGSYLTYQNLLEAAKNADEFIVTEYRPELIERLLSNQNNLEVIK